MNSSHNLSYHTIYFNWKKSTNISKKVITIMKCLWLWTHLRPGESVSLRHCFFMMLPVWEIFQEGWDMWSRWPCSRLQTWGRSQLWKTAEWWQSLPQHLLSPSDVSGHPNSCLPQGAHWGNLHRHTISQPATSRDDLRVNNERTSNTNIKVVIKLRADVLDQVHGVVEAFFLFLPVCTYRVWKEKSTTVPKTCENKPGVYPKTVPL